MEIVVECRKKKMQACDVPAGGIFEYEGEYFCALKGTKPTTYQGKPCNRNIALLRGSIVLIPVDAQVRMVRSKEMVLR